MDKRNNVDVFVENSTMHGKYTLEGNHKEANKAYSVILEAVKGIFADDPELNSLEYLLNHEDDSVKVFSATELLFTNKKDKAINVLKKISNGGGLIAFTAKMVLSEYKSGNLKPLHSQNINLK